MKSNRRSYVQVHFHIFRCIFRIQLVQCMLPCRPCGRVREFLHTLYNRTLRVCRLRMLSNLFRCKSLLVRCEFPNRARVRRFLDRSYKYNHHVCKCHTHANLFRCMLRAVQHGVLSHVPRGFRIFRYIFRTSLALCTSPCHPCGRAREFLHALNNRNHHACRCRILSNPVQCKLHLFYHDVQGRDQVPEFRFVLAIFFRILNSVCLR